MLVRMAILSALRRPKRAFLVILAVALSVFIMEFVSGWVEGTKERMDRKIGEETAHLLVESKARFTSLDLLEPRDYMDDWLTIADHFRRETGISRVEKVTPFGALMLAGEKNLPLKVYGIEAGTGFFAQLSRGRVRGGFPLVGAGIAVSEEALKLLGVPHADRLTILVQDVSGSPSYRELPIACVFRTDDTTFDTSTAFVDEHSAAELLGTEAVAELWIRLDRPGQAEEVRSASAPFLQSHGCVARTWLALQGDLLVLVKLMSLFMLVINGVVLVVAATVITNAILMNIFEKQREFGTLRAIGMRRRGQALLVMIEGAAQGLVGAILGAVLAFPLIEYLKRSGLPIGEASRLFGGGDVMYFGGSFLVTLRNIGIGASIALLGSLYAALVGTRASIVEALKGG
jgi:putative ABC transport system permease protein